MIKHTNAGITKISFNNGFRLLLAPFKNVGQASVHFVIQVGSKHEEPFEKGFAHLLEHMQFKQSKNYADIMKSMSAFSLDMNANTSTERTHYYTVVEKQSVLKALDFEFDRFEHSCFTPTQLHSEIQVVMNEMQQSDSNPSRAAIDIAMRNIYQHHGYNHRTLGSYDDVEGATHDALMAFYKKHYTYDNAFAMVVGDFDEDAVINFVQSRLPQTPVAPKPRYVVEDPLHHSSGSTLHKDHASALYVVGWRIPGQFCEDTLNVDIALQALTSSKWGLLHEEWCKRQGYPSLSSFVWEGLDYSTALVMLSDKQKDMVSDTPQKIIQEMHRSMDAPEFENAVQQTIMSLRSMYERGVSSWQELPEFLLQGEILGDWQFLLTWKQQLERTSLEHVKHAAKKWLNPDFAHTVLLNPVSKEETQYPRATLGDISIEPPFAKEIDAPLTSFAHLESHIRKTSFDNHITAGYDHCPQDGRVHCTFVNVVGTPVERGTYKAGFKYPGLLQNGTLTMPKEIFAARLNQLEAQVEWNPNGFSLSVLKENLIPALTLIFEVYQHPHLEEQPFQLFVNQELNRVRTHEIDPNAILQISLARTLDPTEQHEVAYVYSIEEREAWIRSLTCESVVESLRWKGKRGTSYFSYHGPVDETQHLEMDALIAGLEKNEGANVRSQAKPYLHTKSEDCHIQMGDKPNGSARGYIVYNTSTHTRQNLYIKLISHILGHSFDSRLWDSIREKGGHAYSVGAHFEVSGDPQAPQGRIAMSASCPSEESHIVLDKMKHEWLFLLQKGITAVELEKAIAHFQNHHTESLLNCVASNYITTKHLFDIPFATWDRDVEDLATITLEEVNVFIQEELKRAPSIWGTARSLP